MKRQKRLIVFLLVSIGTLLAVLLSSMLAETALKQPPVTDYQLQKSPYKISKSITVKVVADDFLGSGVIVAQQDNIYTVLTNDHVLRAGEAPYQIQTSDGQMYEAEVKLRESALRENDLAVLQFTSPKTSYNIAHLETTIVPEEKVFAAGFPYAQANQDSMETSFAFVPGSIFLLLDKPLEGGYQLGYTNEVEKGMSGGPLLNSQGKVIAINGMHAYPLWGDPYVYKDGTAPTAHLHQQMSKYSWGIPIQTWQQLYSHKSFHFESKPNQLQPLDK